LIFMNESGQKYVMYVYVVKSIYHPVYVYREQRCCGNLIEMCGGLSGTRNPPG